MKTTLYLLFIFFFFLPTPVYAYLDPGSGNAIVYVLMSFMGAFVFSLKSIFYALMGKKDDLNERASNAEYLQIVIFSEGKQYWNTFKVVVDTLIKREVCFSYYTMNVNDPCLEIDSPYINNRYIGNGNLAHLKIGKLKANVMLSTTPNIGTEGFPIPRSKYIKELVHVFHSYDGIGAYHIGSLDNYDTVLTVGDFEEKVIRDLEEARNLPKKKIVPAGLPYLDELSKNKKVVKHNDNRVTVLVAPSWSTKGCLTEYGSDFIQKIAAAGYNVIIRPHPQSLKVEQDLIQKIKDDLKDYNNIEWDTDVDGSMSMAKADIMISDASRVRIDFMLVYNKPVITLKVPEDSMHQFECFYMKEVWVEKEIEKYGLNLDHSNISHIVDKIEDVLKDNIKEELLAFKNRHVFNWERSGEVIADYLIEAGKKYQEEKQNATL